MLKRFTKNIFYFPFGENDRPTLAAISGSQHTLLVDAGNSPDHANLFLSSLSKYDLSPIRYAVLTHWHWDHSFGLSAINATSLAHKKTVEKLMELTQLDWDDEAINNRVQGGTENIFVRDMIKQEYPDPHRKISIRTPEIAFTREIEIRLGKIQCLIEHVGGDHSPDSSVVIIPEDNVVFIGDCLYPNPYRNVEYTSQNLFPLIKRLLSYDVDLYIASHATPMSKKNFQQKCQLLQEVGSLVRKYKNQNAEIIKKLKNKAIKEEILIDKTWIEEVNYLINAFQAGLNNNEKNPNYSWK